ncbi:unnamed protein product [Arctia plantaginis]|uniref:Uncharacterized protein n=1 Tax=Arctia plantaginis TaxID=874455 RepID=A0A8S1B0K7_ARCPL|nr:unnamed protein product [Arctia plantaginis]
MLRLDQFDRIKKMQNPTAFFSERKNQNLCIAPKPCVGPYKPKMPHVSYAAPTQQRFQPNTCFMPASAIRMMSNNYTVIRV